MKNVWPFTKKQRAEIYEKVLWTIGDDNDIGVCITLMRDFSGDHNLDYSRDVKIVFPEFYKVLKQMLPPDEGDCGAFDVTPAGNAQRRLALERAIKLCNQ